MAGPSSPVGDCQIVNHICGTAEAIEAMMHPESSPYACPGPRGAPRGNDPNFLDNPHLDRERLARMKEPELNGEMSWRPGETFEPRTCSLARQLGYS